MNRHERRAHAVAEFKRKSADQLSLLRSHFACIHCGTCGLVLGFRTLAQYQSDPIKQESEMGREVDRHVAETKHEGPYTKLTLRNLDEAVITMGKEGTLKFKLEGTKEAGSS
jgi:hypothetical protein